MSKLLPNLRLPALTGRRVPLRGAIEVALVLLLAAQAARLLWLVLAPLGPIGTAAAAPAPVQDVPLSLSGDPFFPAARSGAAGASALGYKLFGVRNADGTGGSAILAGDDGAQQAFQVGEKISDGLVLQAVGPDYAVLRSGGTDHRITLQETSGSTPATRTSTVPAAALPAARNAAAGTGAAAAVDPQQLLAQAGLRARTENGRVTGYTLIPRGGGALLRQAGLESGDVLLAVNGQALTPERMTELERELAGRDRAELTVQRGGETKTITLRTSSP